MPLSGSRKRLQRPRNTSAPGWGKRWAGEKAMRDQVDRIMETLRAMKAADARRRRERPGSLEFEQAQRDVERYADRVFGLGHAPAEGGAADEVEDDGKDPEQDEMTG